MSQTSNRARPFAFSRRQFLAGAGACLVASAAGRPMSAAWSASLPADSGSVVLLKSRPSSPMAEVDMAVAAALRSSGMALETVDYDALLAGLSQLSSESAFLIIDSPHLPWAAYDAILEFAAHSRQIILLGGAGFDDPLLRVGREWLTLTEWNARIASLQTDGVVLAVADTAAWARSASRPQEPSSVSVDLSGSRPCYRFDLKRVAKWKWDVFTTSTISAPAQTNALLFWAKGDAHTPECSILVKTVEGTNWRLKIPLETGWRRVAALAKQFAAGGRAPNTGLRLADITHVTIGLEVGGANYSREDHTIWLGEIAAGRIDESPAPDNPQPVFWASGEYGVYRMPDVRSAVACEGQQIIPRSERFAGQWSGVSSVGIPLASKSHYAPLLQARDSGNQPCGWAMGQLIHFAGPYSGSVWTLAGIENADFYCDPHFGEVLTLAIRAARSGSLPHVAQMADAAESSATYPLKTSPPAGYVTRTAEGNRFADPNGTGLFFIGANYLGQSNAHCKLTVSALGPDFERARDAGVNFLRLWVGVDEFDSAKNDAIRECARKYGIYLLLHFGFVERDGEQIVEKIRSIARLWADEPMVLGYDLKNEPYVTEIGAIEFGGKTSPVLALNPYDQFASLIDKKRADSDASSRSNWPTLAKWTTEQEARQLYAAHQIWDKFASRYNDNGKSATTNPLLDGPLDISGPYAQVVQAIDQTFALWIEAQAAAIRSVAPHHFVTVGYNSLLSALPCNKTLDFVSQHVYEGLATADQVELNSTSLDRLALVWKNMPVTLGEFGYSDGAAVDGKTVDVNTSAAAEMAVLLTALAHGRAGCAKWMLNDIPEVQLRDCAPWVPQRSWRTEGRFGLYAYDGTQSGCPKPIVHALRFLREYVDAGGIAGEMRIDKGSNGAFAGYFYKSSLGVFAGSRELSIPGLTVSSPTGAIVNIGMHWARHGLRVQADTDCAVELDPSTFVSTTPAHPSLLGRTAGITRDSQRIRLSLLAGEPVTIA